MCSSVLSVRIEYCPHHGSCADRIAVAYPQFLRRFGVDDGSGDIQIPAPWQAGLGNGGAVGQIVGLLVSVTKFDPFISDTS